MATPYTFFAPCPRGLEQTVAAELAGLCAASVTPTAAGVAFSGDIETGYRACLWLRSASRVLLTVASFPAPFPDALYEGVLAVDWPGLFDRRKTFAVDFSSTRSQITHTAFGAMKAKDAIADCFRARHGTRPDVDRDAPDVLVNIHVHEDRATVSIDLSGAALHRRTGPAYRGAAPMKETLAAGILLLAGWPAAAAAQKGFLDPMCGSGTLVVEAARIAADLAPGLARRKFGFLGWTGHDSSAWTRIRAEASDRARSDRQTPPIVGCDNDPDAVAAAMASANAAGVSRRVRFERRELSLAEPVSETPGLVILNPPYGERLGREKDLEVLYQRIGATLKARFPGWTGWVLTGNRDLVPHLGLKPTRRIPLYNGPIECRLLCLPILEPVAAPEPVPDVEPPAERSPVEGPAPLPAAREAPARGPGESGAPLEQIRGAASPIGNRLKKNLAHLSRWLRREGVTCYRLYDADMPEYAFTVDVYEKWVHVQEYERPSTVLPIKAEERLHEAVAALPEVLGVPRENLFVKQRQGGLSRYPRLSGTERFETVTEAGLRFLVNFTDRFDAGLFLDHRPMRAMIRREAAGKSFLNLFCYTGSATVAAAAGGATRTTSVDLSSRYVEWTRRNLEANGLAGRTHEVLEADALRFLEKDRGTYDLVYMDPPTFSNSKSMTGTLDVQRDQVALIRLAVARLAPAGVLLFSNNNRRFKIDRDALSDLVVRDITRQSIPPDFTRSRRIHNAWRIEATGPRPTRT